MNKLRELLGKDVVERAVKTFVQATLAALLAVEGEWDTAVFVGVIGAGISAVWNTLRVKGD